MNYRKRRNEFDKDFERMQKFAYIAFAINVLIALAVLSGIAFVVYKILSHFGIL
jgi:thiosulfate reductase cytochrome b subunit